MSVPPSDSTPETSDDTRWTEDATFYWDWYKHEENLATSRGNFFLVGQSMLFAAYAALRAAAALVRLMQYCRSAALASLER